MLLLALACPEGVKAIPDLVEKARLQQARVTKELRVQARRAVERFIQEILDNSHNANASYLSIKPEQLGKALWKEGLIIVYRLLFILKLETSDNPAQAFSFASTSLWRNTFSPSMALASYARKVLDDGWQTGSLLESGMRALFKMFVSGIDCTEMSVKPLGGALFGENATPVLSSLTWGERAVAHLLDQLLWTTPQKGKGRERVHYAPLDVEDLGRVYEALLELEPGITTEPMCRLRRQKLEVVVPVAQGEKYRPANPTLNLASEEIEEDIEEIEETEEEEETSKRGKKTKVEWIEEISPRRFYLRVGLGRKASGSYYTPHSFVRFLVKETLEPQINERSPKEDPNPGEILKLKVLDPSMGSGHFLVEACRYLGEKLYEACRLCDELASSNSAKAQIYRQRVIDLPDPDDKLMKYLPSAAPEGQETGFSQAEAIALCRRLVAVHCLYGVDKNPLAVELAKLSLWLESHAEGLPLTFLDHRLVLGDSLTGPFFEHLLKYPGGKQDRVDDVFAINLRQQFKQKMNEALKYARDLEATIGINIADILTKQAAKEKLDAALAPFKIVAAAWSGGVMLGNEGCSDLDYSWLIQAVAATGELPEDLADKPKLLAMIARGLGIEQAPSTRDELLAVLNDKICVPALAYDLAFAEVFYRSGDLEDKQGFSAVLGNPPWDRIRPFVKEFYAAIDFSILDAPTKRERDSIEQRLSEKVEIRTAFEAYVEEFDAQGRVHDTKFSWQSVRIGDIWAGRGNADAYCLFAESSAYLLQPNGYLGFVLPSAFYANEGATGIRQLYLQEMSLKFCYSFENRKKLFEIDSRFKFAVIVATRREITKEFLCAFYLHNDDWLFDNQVQEGKLKYSLEFVQKTGGEYLNFLELKSTQEFNLVKTCFDNGQAFGKICDNLDIKIGRELDMTRDSWRFTPTSKILSDDKDPRDTEVTYQLIERGYLVLHEGKTFHQYTDKWEERPRYILNINQVLEKNDWLASVPFYRLSFREIASSTNERTAIFTLSSPGYMYGNKAPCERHPFQRASWKALTILAVANSFCFDILLRQRVQATINLFILNSTPIPIFKTRPQNSYIFLTHSALRLTCNHIGYFPLWQEQLGETWREPKPSFTFPVLATDDERWQVRAAIDAVVADAYGLNREQYTHILSTFSHKSYPKAPQLCLACFDELQSIGIEAFTKKYNPYWDIPLNENLPQPVIELPILNQNNENAVSTDDGSFQLSGEAPPKKTRRKKK
ncbi:unknown protein [Calothrix sp. PCC 7716]|nr:unknown protein [Calothrix sp. PCC 7716]